jgi:hypothetical protein
VSTGDRWYDYCERVLGCPHICADGQPCRADRRSSQRGIHDEEKNTIEALLERLREESDALPEDATAAREHMENLGAQISHRLSDPREDNQDEQLIASVTEAIERFEIEHPRVTGVLNDVLVVLSGLGI